MANNSLWQPSRQHQRPHLQLCPSPRLPSIHLKNSKFAKALSAVAPIILNQGKNNFIIIHIRNESANQYSTFNIDDWLPPIYIRDPLVPVPPLIYERHSGGPQLYYLTLNSSPPTSTLNSQPSTLNYPLNPKLSTPHSI